MHSERVIGPYEQRQAACREHDPRTAEAARQVAVLIESRLPGCVVEHIGSTAVPGLAGKGVIDLMLLYSPGRLASARDALDSLGFQRQEGPDPFPEDRPMRTGSVEHGGGRFLLHVHVIASDSPEADVLRAFRDRLRAEPALRDAYVGCKRALLAEGTTDPVEYCLRKGEFVEQVLRGLRSHREGAAPAVAFPDRLETPRLVLSRPKEADLPDLTAMHTDPRVMATLGGLLTSEQLDARHRLLFSSWKQDGFGWWVARYRPDGRFVGRGGLRRVQVGGRPEVEVGYGLVPDFWGQGLATELARESIRVGFAVLGLPELVSFTLPTNVRSRRVMEKAGFRYERDIEHTELPHVLYRLRREDWAGGGDT